MERLAGNSGSGSDRLRQMDRLGILGRDKDPGAMVRVGRGSSVLSSAQRLMEFLPLGTVF